MRVEAEADVIARASASDAVFSGRTAREFAGSDLRGG